MEKAKAAKGVIAWQAFAWDELARLLNETFARTNYQWKKHEDDFVEWWDGVPHIAPQSEAPSEIVYWLGVLNAERQDVTARKNPNDLDDFVRKFADGKVVAARAVERLHRKIRVRDVRS